ncbi:MAG: hypothetical protein IT536_13880 [Hyphomicrobiales bacterium]|nr:hypothetical protein [Hyphomicrobiales bacterium]
MTVKPFSVWIGFDPREAAAFAVARESIRRFDRSVPIDGLVLSELQDRGLYTRPTERKFGKLWDKISGTYMATEFAIARFLVPELVRRRTRPPHGWALFLDCDVMVRRNLYALRALLDDSKALMCVPHEHSPHGSIRMNEQVQTAYARKNRSSVMAFNCDHPANEALTADMVNAMPGLKLHQFCWLADRDIGALPPAWNWLCGHTEGVDDPKIVHWTDGGPRFANFRNVPFAQEWFALLGKWARHG